jgi:DNA-binding MurR/RpiR family transcriptional regulator
MTIATTSADATGSCLPRIQGQLRSSSKTTAKIARFVLDSSHEARYMPITALAAACGTSLATVSRFCRELGYSNYREFQYDLATGVAQAENLTLGVFPEGSNPEAIIQRVFAVNRQSLVETESIVGRDQIIRVAQMLRRARRVFLLGNGSSAMAAQQAADRFMSLGLTAMPLNDPYLRIFATANVNRRDVLIGISHTGQNAMVVEAIQVSREKGASTVAVTNYPQSPLAKAAEVSLITAYREETMNAAVSTSIIPQLCVLECIYFILGSWSNKRVQRMADEAEARTQKVVRKSKPVSGGD